MKSILRATAILSSSSIASILLSLVSAKVMALYIHPEGYGYYGLLQSFVSVTSLLAGVGMATGIVKLGAASAARDEATRIASLRWASWLIFAVLGALAMVVISVFREGLSQLVLGQHHHGGMILLMGVASLFTVATNIQVGTLNAYHRVGALAKNGILNTFLSSSFSIASVIIWRARGIPVAVLGGAIVTWIVSQTFLNREVGRPLRAPLSTVLQDAKALLRFGGPYMASMFVGTGVQMLLPILVLHLLNPESVGYYRAAAAISVGYLGFLVTAMGQDYYPRVSAAAHEPAQLISLINAQHRLVMVLVVPMILGTLALTPYLVPLIYSAKFHPAVDILEWQLIGDLFKFASWTMSFAVLARCAPSLYFLTECVGGAVTLGTTWFGIKLLGMQGLGISFLVTYVVYYCIVWVVIRREIPLRLSGTNRGLFFAGIVGAMVIRILPATPFSHDRTAVALSLALLAGIFSLMILWRDYRATRSEPRTGLPDGEAPPRQSLQLS